MNQGGNQDAIIKFVLGLAETLQADPKQIVLIAQQNPDALEAAVNTFQQTLDMNQAAQAFLQTLQNKTAVARHGAKLQYLKNLKHLCAEDEEVVYFKNGGLVDCGCQKKKGGEIEKAQNGTKAVSKFKNDYSSKRVKDSEEDYFKGTADHTRPGNTPVSKTVQNFKKKKEQTKVEKKPETKPIKKNCGGSAIKKFKMHRQGGSLNGIPFMQAGTPKGGLPTAQKAAERYKGARGIMYGKGNVNIQEIENTDNNAKIRLAIVDNDSTITETPPHSWYITPKNRISDNYAPGGDKKYLDKDWPIMRRRWEEAKKVMSKEPYYAGPLYGTYPLPK